MDTEKWVIIANTNGDYSASSLGRIKSNRYGRIINGTKTAYGYIDVCIRGKLEKAHRVIAEAFIPNIDNKPEVNHRNGIKDDNRVDNLEWVTKSENQIHRYRVLNLDGNIRPLSMYTHDGIFITSFRSISECVSMIHCSNKDLMHAVKNGTVYRGCIFKLI